MKRVFETAEYNHIVWICSAAPIHIISYHIISHPSPDHPSWIYSYTGMLGLSANFNANYT